MQRAHQLGQFGHREADLGTRREVRQAEIHRIGTSFDRGAKLRPVTRRTHDFGFNGLG
jgi:hypothetical protein